MKVRVWAFLLAALFSNAVFATAQAPEKLIYQGKEYSLQTHPLAKYFEKHPEKKPDTGGMWNTALSRGYVATFEIKNKELFLKDIHADKYSKEKNQWEWKSVLAEVLDGKPEMKIDWFSGVLRIPEGKRIAYVHQGYLSTYEKYLFIEIKEGNFVREVRMPHEKYTKFIDKYMDTLEYHEGMCGCDKPDSTSKKTFAELWDEFNAKDAAPPPPKQLKKKTSAPASSKK